MILPNPHPQRRQEPDRVQIMNKVTERGEEREKIHLEKDEIGRHWREREEGDSRESGWRRESENTEKVWEG